jgi:hypothetical protein
LAGPELVTLLLQEWAVILTLVLPHTCLLMVVVLVANQDPAVVLKVDKAM